MTKNTAPNIRRIVTGHDIDGKAKVWIDAPATSHKFPTEHLASTLMWVTDETPTDFMQDIDQGNRQIGTAPPAGGTRFCVIEIAPGNAFHGMHRTDTIDYVICMAGELEMDLDDSTVTMNAGDIMIQRGTKHAWMNRSTQLARIAVVLIDGHPKRADSVSGTVNAR